MRMRKSAANRLRLLGGIAVLALAACATDTIVLTGSARPPISPADVRI